MAARTTACDARALESPRVTTATRGWYSAESMAQTLLNGGEARLLDWLDFGEEAASIPRPC